MSDDMAAAYDRYYADKRAIDAMCRTLEAFCTDPPDRANPAAVDALRGAIAILRSDSDHIVAVWD